MSKALDIEVVEGVREHIPEAGAARLPIHLMCSSLASIANTIAVSRKWNPAAARVRMEHDLIRLVSVAKHSALLDEIDSGEIDLQLFLSRDAQIDVPHELLPELAEHASHAAEALQRLVRFMLPLTKSG